MRHRRLSRFTAALGIRVRQAAEEEEVELLQRRRLLLEDIVVPIRISHRTFTPQ